MDRQLARRLTVILGSIAGLIHWYLLIDFFDIPFLLNGLGFFVLVAAFILKPPIIAGHRRLFHYLFIGYTAVTVLAWTAVGARNAIGFASAIVELGLILVLWQHLRAVERDQVSSR
jgi:hypothetical protein